MVTRNVIAIYLAVKDGSLLSLVAFSDAAKAIETSEYGTLVGVFTSEQLGAIAALSKNAPCHRRIVSVRAGIIILGTNETSTHRE